MTPTQRVLAACTLTLALAACQQEAPQPAATAPAPETPEITVGEGQGPQPVAEGSVVTGNELAMVASDPRVQNWDGIGTREAGRLVSNATNGYLMFGPKVPFEAGKYRVTVFGDVLTIAEGNKIVFDVTCNGVQQVFGKTELDQTAKLGENGELASWDVDVTAPVTDIEVRAFVTSGATVAITRYEVKPAAAQAN